MNFQRTLADTTAESQASVKHTDHIDRLRIASDGGGAAWNLEPRKRHSGSKANARSAESKGTIRLCFFQRGEKAVKQDPPQGQRLKIGNDAAGHHLFGGKYHLKGEESDVARTKPTSRSSGRYGGMRNYMVGLAQLRLGRKQESQ